MGADRRQAAAARRREGQPVHPEPDLRPGRGKPGALDEYFRGRNPKGADPRKLFGELEPIRPEYRDRDARLALMDAQGMEGCILLPTLGVGMEQALRRTTCPR